MAAVSPGAYPPGGANRTNHEGCFVRKRVDSPTPIFVAMDSSFARCTGPARPMDGQGDAPAPYPGEPLPEHARVEAEVAHDVRGVLALVPHRLDGDVVVDERMALGVTGDTDVREGAPSSLSPRSTGSAPP